MADSRKNKNRCSFCGRTEDEVGFLITGMNGYICDSCATQAYEITQEALGAGKKASATKLNLKELPKPVSICHWSGRCQAFLVCVGVQPLQTSAPEGRR